MALKPLEEAVAELEGKPKTLPPLEDAVALIEKQGAPTPVKPTPIKPAVPLHERNEPQAPITKKINEYGERAMGGVVSGTLSTLGSAAGIGEWLWDSKAAGKAMDKLDNVSRNFFPDKPGYYDQAWSALGSSLPYLIMGLGAGGLAKVNGLAKTLLGASSGGFTEALAEAPRTYRDALKRTGSRETAYWEALRTFYANLPLNVATNIPLFSEGKSLFGKMLKTGLSQAAQESGQSVINQHYGNDNVDWKQALQEGVVALPSAIALGGMVGGAQQAMKPGPLPNPNAVTPDAVLDPERPRVKGLLTGPPAPRPQIAQRSSLYSPNDIITPPPGFSTVGVPRQLPYTPGKEAPLNELQGRGYPLTTPEGGVRIAGMLPEKGTSPIITPDSRSLGEQLDKAHSDLVKTRKMIQTLRAKGKKSSPTLNERVRWLESLEQRLSQEQARQEGPRGDVVEINPFEGKAPESTVTPAPEVAQAVPEALPKVKQPWEMTRGNFYQHIRSTESPAKANAKPLPDWGRVKKDVGFEFITIKNEVQPTPKQRISGGFTVEQESAIKKALSAQGFSVDKYRVRGQEEQAIPTGGGWRARGRDVYPTSPEHERAVRKALSEGKPVPPEVLAEYPDLAPKSGIGPSVPKAAKSHPGNLGIVPPWVSDSLNAKNDPIGKHISFGADVHVTPEKFANAVKEGLYIADREMRDRFAGARNVVDKVSNHIKEFGQEVSDKANVYENMRLFNHRQARADIYSRVNLEPLYGQLTPQEHKGFSEYLVAKHAADIHRYNYEHHGEKGFEPISLPFTQEQAGAKIAEGNANPKFVELQKQLMGYKKQLLQDTLVDSGLMSQESLDFLTQKWPNHVPYFREGSEAEMEAFYRGDPGGFLNLSDPIKKLEGGNSQIVDPLESILKTTGAYFAIAEKNRVRQSILELAKNPGFESLAGPAEEGKPMFTVWIDGKAHHFTTDPALFDSLQRLDATATDIYTKILAAPASLARATMTVYNPAFTAWNLLRDTFMAPIVSPHWSTLPVFTHVDGFLKLFNPALRQEYEEAGASGASFVKNDRKVLGKTVDSMLSRSLWETVARNAQPKQFFRGLGYIIQEVNDMVEQAPHASEYFKARQRGASEQKAAMVGLDATIDFDRGGSTAKKVNKVTAFFNVGIQGPDRVARAFKERPAMTSAKIFTYIALPSILLWALNHDKDEYKRLSRTQKDLNWVVCVNGTCYRIPKPFEVGLFGSAVERALDAHYEKDPHAWDGFKERVFQNLTPNIIPTAFGPIRESFLSGERGYDSFFDKYIIPEYQKDFPPDLQYGPSTPERSKAIAKMLGTSPRKVDHVMRGWIGPAGQMPLDAIETALAKAGVIKRPERPDSKPSQLPIVGKFFAPDSQAQPVQDFYTELDDLTERYKRFRTTGVGEGFNYGRYKYFGRIASAISALYKRRREIEADMQMSGKEKRSKIDAIEKRIVGLAEQSLKQKR